MKKVVLAILMVASKEKTVCDLTINTKGGHFSTSGALELESTSEQLSLRLWRGGEVCRIELSPDESDLSVNQSEAGKFEIAVGGICVTFRDPFKADPFSVTNG